MQHGLNLHGVVVRGALPNGIEGLLGQFRYPHHRDHGQEGQEQQLEEVAEPGMHLAEWFGHFEIDRCWCENYVRKCLILRTDRGTYQLRTGLPPGSMPRWSRWQPGPSSASRVWSSSGEGGARSACLEKNVIPLLEKQCMG